MTRLSNGLPAQSACAEVGGFAFLDPGPLVDDELELVTPDERWADDLLAACHHPLTRCDDPEHASMTRAHLLASLQTAPRGLDPGDPRVGRSPTYHFWMRLRSQFRPPVPFAGTISLRVGHTPDLELYFGHVGYNVYPPARGHHYAARACRLLFDLARRHQLRPLWITTDPHNLPSRKTCERLGATLVEIIDVPRGHILHQRGQRRKCRYCINL